MSTPRRLLLLLLTVSWFGLAVPSVWAAFTNPTTRAVATSFSTATLTAPTIASVKRCTLSVVVTWTPSVSTFVTSQLVELSTSAIFDTVAQSTTFNDNTTQTDTFNVGLLTTYYVRVTAKFGNWSTASTILVATVSLC